MGKCWQKHELDLLKYVCILYNQKEFKKFSILCNFITPHIFIQEILKYLETDTVKQLQSWNKWGNITEIKYKEYSHKYSFKAISEKSSGSW